MRLMYSHAGRCQLVSVYQIQSAFNVICRVCLSRPSSHVWMCIIDQHMRPYAGGGSIQLKSIAVQKPHSPDIDYLWFMCVIKPIISL